MQIPLAFPPSRAHEEAVDNLVDNHRKTPGKQGLLVDNSVPSSDLQAMNRRYPQHFAAFDTLSTRFSTGETPGGFGQYAVSPQALALPTTATVYDDSNA